MKWNKKLYIGDKALKDRHKLIKTIKRNKFSPLLYIIFLENGEVKAVHISIFNLENSTNKMNIFKKLFRTDRDEKLILGFAIGKFEALEEMAKIVAEVYKNTGAFEYETYFKV